MVDADGEKVGSVEDIYLDRQTGEPEWVTVRTGLFGTKVSFVPIHDAERTEDGKIRVPFEKKPVKDAPRTEPDGELSPEEEQRLYEHFGAPPVVGVRLRRIIVVAAAPVDDEQRAPRP